MRLEVTSPGEAVGGSRYRVLGRLGSGGMADVDLALQTGVAGTSRLCALKRVRKDLPQRAEFVSMFFEEARISASLQHPNVVQVYEVGGDEHECFLAMEFLRGRSYAQLEAALGPARDDYLTRLEVMIGTLTGLEHVHERRDLSGQPMKLVHRDISPPNVFVTYEGEVKVLDFGVAKSKTSQVHTKVGILKGKAAYMAPEMVAGQPLDGRADLYAVGAMLWEATAGRERWPRMNEMVILAYLSRGGPVEPPGAVERGLPELADRICVRALAADPDERYQTAAELRADLLELCQLLGGRPGQTVLKDFLAQRFAAERRSEEREIDSALAALREGREPGARAEEKGGSTKRLARRPSDTPILAVEQVTPRPKNRGRALLGAALVLGLVVLAVSLLKPASDARTGGAPSTSAPRAVETPSPVSTVASSAPSVPLGPALKSASEPAVKPPTKQGRAPALKKPPARSAGDLSLDREDPWK